jgi:hypothetical protein
MGVSFSTLCRFHAGVDLLLGAATLASVDKAAAALHGDDIAARLVGDAATAAADERVAAVRASESLVGLLLVDLGLVLGVVATAREARLQRNFAAVAAGTHALTALWRWRVASCLPALHDQWRGQLVGDLLLGGTWLGFLYGARRRV